MPALAAFAIPAVASAIGSALQRRKKFDPLQYFQQGYNRLKGQGYGALDINPILEGIDRGYDTSARREIGSLGQAQRVTGSAGTSVASLFAPGRINAASQVAKTGAQREARMSAAQAQDQAIRQALTAGLPSAAETATRPSGLASFAGNLLSAGGQAAGAYLGQQSTQRELIAFLNSPEAQNLEPSTRALLLLMAKGGLQ